MVIRDYMFGEKGLMTYAGDVTSGGPSDQHDLPPMTIRKVSRVLGGQLPTLRLMEVLFHHVDLDAGYTFADADPGWSSGQSRSPSSDSGPKIKPPRSRCEVTKATRGRSVTARRTADAPRGPDQPVRPWRCPAMRLPGDCLSAGGTGRGPPKT